MRPVEIPPAEQTPADVPPHGAGAGHDRSATEDLADGLDLMLRAARKALHSLDPRIEEVGRKALERLEALDATALETAKRARQRLDVGKLEHAAQEAGREVVKTVERLAERIEAVFGGGDAPKSTPGSSTTDEVNEPPEPPDGGAPGRPSGG
jgi:predicted phage gp36 major capsid-like protein